jgi:hypothetical protein
MLTRVSSCLFEISSTGLVELDVVAEYAVIGITCTSPGPGMTIFPILEGKSRYEHWYPIRPSQARRCCLTALPRTIIGKTNGYRQSWRARCFLRCLQWQLSFLFWMLSARCMQATVGHAGKRSPAAFSEFPHRPAVVQFATSEKYSRCKMEVELLFSDFVCRPYASEQVLHICAFAHA